MAIQIHDLLVKHHDQKIELTFYLEGEELPAEGHVDVRDSKDSSVIDDEIVLLGPDPHQWVTVHVYQPLRGKYGLTLTVGEANASASFEAEWHGAADSPWDE